MFGAGKGRAAGPMTSDLTGLLTAGSWQLAADLTVQECWLQNVIRRLRPELLALHHTGSCVGMWLVDWLMTTHLCFELLAVAVGLAAIAVNFLNSLMIVCCTRPSTLDRCEGSADSAK